MSDFKNVYQHFISLEMAAEVRSDYPSLEPVEKRILSLLTTYWFNKKPITVVGAIHMTPEISSSTMFRYLKQLRQKGYVESIVDELDNRIKYVSPTKQANRYFAKLGKLMSQASVCD